MKHSEMLADAKQRYYQATGKDVQDLHGTWHIIISLYGKESLMDSAESLAEALTLGAMNRLFIRVCLPGHLSYEPGATSKNRLKLL